MLNLCCARKAADWFPQPVFGTGFSQTAPNTQAASLLRGAWGFLNTPVVLQGRRNLALVLNVSWCGSPQEWLGNSPGSKLPGRSGSQAQDWRSLLWARVLAPEAVKNPNTSNSPKLIFSAPHPFSESRKKVGQAGSWVSEGSWRRRGRISPVVVLPSNHWKRRVTALTPNFNCLCFKSKYF